MLGDIMSINNEKYSFAVIGGDSRQVVIANELIRRGHEVKVFGLGNLGVHCVGAELLTSLEKAVDGSEIILLPLPVTRDNVNLLLASDPKAETVPLIELVRLASRYKCCAILGGMLPDGICSLCEKEGVFARDYYKSDDLQKKNALPSAEGALMIAMEHTDITVKDMKALVCGYGRIGTLLASMLRSLGAEVTVAARRDETLCEISMDGYRSLRLDGNAEELGAAVDACDVVFNTVPSVILTSSVLGRVKSKPLYIEIASLPGGIDLSAARDARIRTVFAPSLPGKYSPRSAGKYIFETISDILAERSINV